MGWSSLPVEESSKNGAKEKMINTNEAVGKRREKKQTVNKNMKRLSFLERAVEECCEKLVAILNTDFCPNSGTHLRKQESLIAIAQRKEGFWVENNY